MVGVIDAFRWCIVGGDFTKEIMQSMGMSLTFTLIVLFFGIRYFRKVEKTFADII
jgi:lipopolysaccharide transport system permease protein